MNINILIVFKELEQAEIVKDILEEKLLEEGHEVIVDMARNEAEANRHIRNKSYDLIITHLHIPADRESPLKEEEQRGLSLLQSLEIPSILVSTSINAKLNAAIHKLFLCKAVVEDMEEWEDDLINCSLDLALGQPIKKQKRLNLDITLNLDENKGGYLLKGVDFPCEVMGPLGIDGKSMSKLARRTKSIGDERSDWQEELRDIGEELMKEIFRNNYNFSILYHEQAAKVGGIKNTRIRFIVKQKIHPIVLEALFGKCEQCQDYWMLHAPIYRRVNNIPGLKYPLFHPKDKETRERQINCLVIEADVDGPADGLKNEKGEIQLPHLKNVRKECEWLENDHLLKLKNQDQYKIGKIKRIRIEEVPEQVSFAEHVEKILKSDTWHLVHYAGHSYYDDKEGGYVFFPRDSFMKKISITVFSQWLREGKVRFIYLSSCHSSEEDFVYELAKNNIPAVIGFRWDIEDDKAEEHAKIFYKYLFEKRSLEYAFLETRKEIYKRHKDNKIWAAPMLIMQVSD